MNFDQSLLKAFSCPRRGALLAGRPHTASTEGPAAIGTKVHELIANYWRHCQENNLQTDLDYGRSIMPSGEAGIIFETFLKSELVSEAPCWIEVRLESGRWFGTPDVVVFAEPGMVKIPDWKTDRRIWSQVEAEEKIQLKFYALLVRDKMTEGGMEPPEAYHLAYHFVRYGEIRNFFFMAEQLAEFEKEVNRMADRAELDLLDPKPKAGSHCQYCEFPLTCPLSMDNKDCPVIVDSAQALELAAKLHAIRRADSILTDVLKAWANEHGEINGGGWRLGFFAHPRESWPDGRAVFDVLANNDVSPEKAWAILHPTKTEINRLIKSLSPHLRQPIKEQINSLAVVKQQTRFEFKRPGGEEEDDAV